MTNNPFFYPNSSFFSNSRVNFPSAFDFESIFDQPCRPSMRSNFLDLDSVAIPIRFEAPVFSRQSRTKSTETSYHQPRHAHFEQPQQKQLLFERSRKPYVGVVSPQIDRVAEEPHKPRRNTQQQQYQQQQQQQQQQYQQYQQQLRVAESLKERTRQPYQNTPTEEEEEEEQDVLQYQYSPSNTQNIRFKLEKPEERQQQSPVPSRISVEEKEEEKTEEEKMEEKTKEEPAKIEEDYPDPNALKERLKLYGMKEKTPIRGDGNCQFAAFSDQYFGDVNKAATVRIECVKWLWNNKDFVLSNGAKIEHFLQTDFFPTWRDYCEYMIQDGTWGDNLTLVALSELYQTKIVIISSIKLSKNQNPCTVIIPSKWDEEENKVAYMSHLHELHYSSICQDEDF
jgi:hypothetical protein